MGESNMGRFNPRGIEPQGGRGKSARLLVLACVFFAVPVALFAQPADPVRSFYVPSRTFNIPFSTDNDPRVVDVLLYVSTDEGKSYNYVDAVRPAAHKFFFSARQDGCYWFIVQTKDREGVLRPAEVRGAAPSMKVWVDTQPPLIEDLSAVPSPPGSPPRIHWKINEANLKDIKADYRSTNGGDWLPLFLPIETEGSHSWKPSWGGQLEVRLWAQDKAGTWSELRTVRLRIADNVSGMRPPPEPTAASKVMHVRSKTFQLQYQLDNESVGPSRVASVDIWKLHQGRGWQKCKETGTPQGPATVSVEASGRWGFRLIPRSGAGLAERDPQQGDTPDIWVEVDDKAPQVKVTNVTVTQEPDGGYLTVYWKADDTFLQPMPITILWKDPHQQGDQWTQLASELPNTGSWRHRTDGTNGLNLGERYEFSLKVTAIDEAGNVGADQWRDVVKIDLKIPRIKSIKIEAGETPAPAGGGQEAYQPQQAPSPYATPQNINPTVPTGNSPLTSPFPGSSRPATPPPSTSNGTGGGFSSPGRPGGAP